MSRVVRCGLIQAKTPLDGRQPLSAIKKAMIDKHLKMIEQAAQKKVKILCLQELFYGPYFCAEQNPRWYELTERVPDGPTTKLMQKIAAKHRMVIVVPVYEEQMPGLYFNTAAVIDADGRISRQVPQAPHPARAPRASGRSSISRPGDLGYPRIRHEVRARSASTSATTGISRKAHAFWDLNGAEIVFNPSATVAGLSEYLWELEQPAHAVARTATLSARSTASAPRSLGASASFMGRVTSATRAERSSRRLAAIKTKSSSPTSISI